jgi:hypothetical protein
MDNELNARHEEELKKHKPQAGDPDNVESAVDEVSESITKAVPK